MKYDCTVIESAFEEIQIIEDPENIKRVRVIKTKLLERSGLL